MSVGGGGAGKRVYDVVSRGGGACVGCGGTS